MTFPPETVERVANAIDAADVYWSMELIRLVDDVRTVRLTLDGDVFEYTDNDDESAQDQYLNKVRSARRQKQATAALAAAWEWRPIEEAPKDGTEILLFDGVDMWSDKWDDDFKDWDVSPFSEPTHWMPAILPPADVNGDV